MSPILKRLFYFIIAFTVLYTPLFAQSAIPHIEWAKIFGGSDIDIPLDIEVTSDNGYIVAGESTSIDGDIAGHHGTTDFNDYWIIKIDSVGNLLWQKSLGGTDDDIANSIKQTFDGGYIVAGHSKSHDGDVSGNTAPEGDNYWIVRLNDNGTILWQKTFGGSGDDVAYDIIQTADSGFIAVGSSNSDDGDVIPRLGTSELNDYWILKLDKTGNIQWQKSYGGTGDDIARSIRQTQDHGYAITGYSNSIDGNVTGNHGSDDYWLIKIDSIGNLLWEKSYGGTSSDNSLSFDLTKDHGFILNGHTNSDDSDVTNNHGQTDYWMIKLDSLGILQWQKCLGGSDIDVGYSVLQTFDGGYITSGFSISNDSEVTGNHGGNDCWVVKLDSQGTLQWEQSIGGPGEEYGLCIRQTSDSGYVISCSSEQQGGEVDTNFGFEDYWIVKLGNKPVNVVNPEKNLSIKITNFPNPFTVKTQFEFGMPVESASELIFYNVIGEKVGGIKILPETEAVTFNRGKLPAGIYVYHLVSDGAILGQGRMMIQ